MQVRHLAIAALLVSATAAHAETVRPHAGTLTGWAAQTMVVGASTAAAIEIPVPSTAVELQSPAAVTPVVAADPIVGAAEVPEPSSIALLLAGVMGVGALRRRRK
jgi:hypothetical protein